MASPSIIEFIRNQLKQGATKASIVNTMTAGGWKGEDVEKAFVEASKDFKLMESSESFVLVTEGQDKHYFSKAIKVFILLVIIVLCVLFYLGGETPPPV